MSLTIVPVTFREACVWIAEHHRHHPPPTGHLFSCAVADDLGQIVGVATAGRPSAKALQDGWTFEVTRSCTDGAPHANSCLYGAVWRAGRALGFRKAITYTQAGESGGSLRAAGWIPTATLAPRRGWDHPSRKRDTTRHPTQIERTRWEVAAGAAPWPVRPRIEVPDADADQGAIFEVGAA